MQSGWISDIHFSKKSIHLIAMNELILLLQVSQTNRSSMFNLEINLHSYVLLPYFSCVLHLFYFLTYHSLSVFFICLFIIFFPPSLFHYLSFIFRLFYFIICHCLSVFSISLFIIPFLSRLSDVQSRKLSQLNEHS